MKLPAGAFLVAATCAAASCGTAVLDPIQGNTKDIGLLAHWTFDEGAGVDVHDATPNRHDGRLMGGIWTAGQVGFGHALSLHRGDHVAIMNFPDATPSWTVSVWVRFAAGDISVGNRAPLIGNESNGGGWEVNAPDDSTPANLEFAYPIMMAGGGGGGGSNHVNAKCCQAPPTDRWIHVTAVLDGDFRTLNIYEGDRARQISAPQLIQPGSTTLTMGAINPMGQQFQGTIDEIRIYNRALSPAEIHDLNTTP